MQQLRLPRLRAERVGRYRLDEGGEGAGRGALVARVDGRFDDEQFQAGEAGVFGAVGLAVGGRVDDGRVGRGRVSSRGLGVAA